MLLLKGSFGFLNSSTARLHEKEMGGGTLLDIGVYLVTFSQMIFGGKFPSKIVAHGDLSSTGVDEQVAIILGYKI
jgi:predicted dehydrogenase